MNVLIDSEISVDHTNAVDGETLFLHRLTQNGKVVFGARTRFEHVTDLRTILSIIRRGP